MLEQPTPTSHDRTVCWRQLVELVARSQGEGKGERDVIDRALAVIREDRDCVPERVRVATALTVASLPLPCSLVAAFAADRLTVAAPILAGARLTASEWRNVTASASDDCRAFIAAMRAEESSGPDAGPSEQTSETSIPSISEVVARIERLRTSRHSETPDYASESVEAPRLFRWECNEAGDIDWVEGAPRGALVGQSIAQDNFGAGVDRSVVRAFASRAPFHDALLELPRDASAGGIWKISGVPAFERSTGRFAGYRGIAQRSSETIAATDPTSLRELVHEIKTPLNAIIGFAEIICGEYLGPADSAYRQRAADIVAQARLLLSAIEDLDFSAKIHAANGHRHARVNLGELLLQTVSDFRDSATAANVQLELSSIAPDLTAAMDREVAQRLIQRLFAAVMARAAEGEALQFGADRKVGRCTVWISRPAALRGVQDQQLFGSAEDALSHGFALRLARGLAHSAGVDLIVSQTAISLAFRRA